MKIANSIRLAAAALVIALVACAEDGEAQQRSHSIIIEDAWAATTNPGATVGAGYVTLRNLGSRADRLLTATSPRAARVELHEMSVTAGVMRMGPVEAIVVPAGGAVTLAPGGLHIMFIDINAPITDGEAIPVTLHFERQGDVDAVFTGRPRGGQTHVH